MLSTPSAPVSVRAGGCGSWPGNQWTPGMETWWRQSPSTGQGSSKNKCWQWQRMLLLLQKTKGHSNNLFLLHQFIYKCLKSKMQIFFHTKVAKRSCTSPGTGVAIINSSHLKQFLGYRSTDNTSTSWCWDQPHHNTATFSCHLDQNII